MHPLTEQRVHLSGNPIKSQGEMLLCLPLIIASLPCTAATGSAVQGRRWGGKSVGQAGATRKRRGRPSHYAHSACTLHHIHHICFLYFFFFCFFFSFCFFFFFSLLLFPFLFLCPSLPPFPSPPLSVPFLIFYS